MAAQFSTFLAGAVAALAEEGSTPAGAAALASTVAAAFTTSALASSLSPDALQGLAQSSIATLSALASNASTVPCGGPAANATFLALGSVLGVVAAPPSAGLGSAVLGTLLGLAQQPNSSACPMAHDAALTVLTALAGSALGSSSSGAAGRGGGPVSYTSLPPAAAAAPNYCGPALAMSSMALPLAGATSAAAPIQLPLTGAMPPCAGASTQGAIVTLPPSIVAAQPPPTVVLPPALLAELRASPLLKQGSAATLQIVQWGVSPFPLNAGTARIPYTPLIKPGTLAAQADAAAAAAEAAAQGAGAPQQRALQLTSSLSGLFSYAQTVVSSVLGGGGLRSTGATVVANAYLRRVAPRATVSYDLLGDRPMDSRVVSVGLTSLNDSGSGAALPLPPLSTPLLITIPLQDLSIVQYSPSLAGVTGVAVGNQALAPLSLSVTCPATPQAALGGIAAVYLRPQARLGERARVTLRNITGLSFTVLSTLMEGAGAIRAADVGFAADALGGGSGGGGGAPRTGPPTQATGISYALQTDCGPPFGNLTFLCGPGTHGSAITFTCPTAATVPACLWYSTAASAWQQQGGCTVANVSATAVTCACMRWGDFAIRFPALQLNDNDLFAQESAVAVSSAPAPSVLLPILCAALLLGTALGAALAWRADAHFRRRYARELHKLGGWVVDAPEPLTLPEPLPQRPRTPPGPTLAPSPATRALDLKLAAALELELPPEPHEPALRDASAALHRLRALPRSHLIQHRLLGRLLLCARHINAARVGALDALASGAWASAVLLAAAALSASVGGPPRLTGGALLGLGCALALGAGLAAAGCEALAAAAGRAAWRLRYPALQEELQEAARAQSGSASGDSDSGAGDGAVVWSAVLLLTCTLAVSLYMSVAFGLLRGDAPSQAVIALYALGCALYCSLLAPAACAGEVHWHASGLAGRTRAELLRHWSARVAPWVEGEGGGSVHHQALALLLGPYASAATVGAQMLPVALACNVPGGMLAPEAVGRREQAGHAEHEAQD